MNLSRCLAAVLVAAMPLAQAATTNGSGRVATETRAAAEFKAIALDGSIDLVVRQGSREAVEVRADDNLLPLIETVVESGTLKIRVKKGESTHTRSGMRVTVEVVRLEAIRSSGSGDTVIEALKTPSLAITLAGSGDARLERIATDDLSLRIAGSSDVVAAGTATRLKVSVAGSGDVRTKDLAADDVSISIAGSGDARVNANKTLDITIAGSGDVEYSGNASVKSSVLGSGSVVRK